MTPINAHGTPARVLLVDRDPNNLMLLSQILKDGGMHILAARDGREALHLASAHQPDLLVLDVELPEMSGHEVCRRIKSDPVTATIPVVFLTTLNAREDRLRALQAGADDFFSKPIYRDEFLIRVNSLVSLHQARRELAEIRLESESGHRQMLRDTFGRYVSPKLLEKILANPGEAAQALLQYETRYDASIMFADLRGFTRMAEQLPASQVVLLLNQYFTLLTRVAYRHDGTIFNMAGDCLLVGFGVPFEQPDAAKLAMNCGLEMLAEFYELAQEWRDKHGLETGLGIGINKGEVVAGNVGSPNYMNFTVIGDAVNVAFRLTERARAGELVLSGTVMDSLRDPQLHALATKLPPLALRGRSVPVSLYCVPATDRLDTRR
jgi:class 3 adenylate cyclase